MRAPDTIRRFRKHFSDIPASERQALQIARLLLVHLADESDFAQLADGRRLRDAIDFSAWLRELEAVVNLQLEATEKPTKTMLDIVRKSLGFCPTCGHKHASGEECEVEMGGAGKCGCRAEVPA